MGMLGTTDAGLSCYTMVPCSDIFLISKLWVTYFQDKLTRKYLMTLKIKNLFCPSDLIDTWHLLTRGSESIIEKSISRRKKSLLYYSQPHQPLSKGRIFSVCWVDVWNFWNRWSTAPLPIVRNKKHSLF